MVRRLLAEKQGEFCKNSREKNYTDVIFFHISLPCLHRKNTSAFPANKSFLKPSTLNKSQQNASL
jgi:hypothetical protein